MSHGSTKGDDLKRKAQLAFREEARAHQLERPLLEEEVRHEDMLAKTKGLRELRLARGGSGKGCCGDEAEEGRLIMFPIGTILTGRVVRMSLLRKKILAALPHTPEAPIPTGKIMERMALAGLAEGGLVLRWHPEMRRPGRGSLWSRAVPMTAGERAARA
jgi:hypothetical protein